MFFLRGQIPRKVCFSLWGDKVDQFSLNEGEEVVVAFDLESREYNGRWYTEVKAWKVSRQSEANEKPVDSPDDFLSEVPDNKNLSDDLPF